MSIDERIKYAKKRRNEAYKKDSVQGIVYWDGYIDALKAVKEDVREIFEEIETYMFYHENIPNTIYKSIDFNIFNKLKKKHTEGEG